MIPKVIHYCWFGGNPKPKLINRCIKSWKKYCPDYEIIEWNEENFDLNCCDYVREAYEAKKWAFVSDYVRIWALYNYGGVYLDTDVEIIKKIDKFLIHKAFTGFEDINYPFTAVFGCIKKHPFAEAILNLYKNKHFVLEDGTFNMESNVILIKKMMLDKYNIKCDNSYQEFNDGLIVYPKEYFCPKDNTDNIIYKTKNTHAIHHFSATWLSEQQKYNRKYYSKQKRNANRIHFILHIPNMILNIILGKKRYNKLKLILKGSKKGSKYNNVN